MNPLNSEHMILAPIDRRRAVQWLLAALTATTALGKGTEGGKLFEYKPVAKGYGTDPDLTKIYKPGDLWPLSFSDSQRSSAALICDIIFPADETSPSASSLGSKPKLKNAFSSLLPASHKTSVTVSVMTSPSRQNPTTCKSHPAILRDSNTWRQVASTQRRRE